MENLSTRTANAHRRPPLLVRLGVLVLAVASLTLTMCHNERRANAPQTSPTQAGATTQAPSAANATPAPAAKPAATPEPKDPKRIYFNATKAPGPL